jgi:amino acid permease
LVIIFIFAFTGVYLKYASVRSLLPPILSDLWSLMSCQQKYLTLSFACLQVGESTMGNKDGFRLERICVGAQEKRRISRLSRNALLAAMLYMSSAAHKLW